MVGCVKHVAVKPTRLVNAPHCCCGDPQLQFDAQQATGVCLAFHVRKPRPLRPSRPEAEGSTSHVTPHPLFHLLLVGECHCDATHDLLSRVQTKVGAFRPPVEEGKGTS